MNVTHEYTHDERYHRVVVQGVGAGPWATTHQLANSAPIDGKAFFASTRHHPALPEVFTVDACPDVVRTVLPAPVADDKE